MENIAPKYNFNNIVASTYEAALAPEKWRPLLINLCNILGAEDIALSFVDTRIIARSFTFNAKTLNTQHEFFFTDSVGKIYPHLKEYPPGTIISSESVTNSAIEYAPSDKPKHFINLSFIVPLFIGNSIYAALFFQQNEASLSAENENILKDIIPHLIKAIHIYNHISSLQYHNATLLEALEHTSNPIFILNTNLEAIFISREAEVMLKRHPAINLSERGHIRVHFVEEQNRLQKVLGDFLTAGFHASYLMDKGVGIAIRHPEKQHPLRMCFVPLQQPELQNPKAPFIAIFVNDPDQPRQIAPEYLKQAFHLTPAEIHAAQLLASGYSITEIAEIRGTTLETGRWQMKQLLQKTNTHSQAELVRLLVLLGNDLNSGQVLLDAPSKTLLT